MVTTDEKRYQVEIRVAIRDKFSGYTARATIGKKLYRLKVVHSWNWLLFYISFTEVAEKVRRRVSDLRVSLTT